MTHRESIRLILELALSAGGGARTTARELINRLSSKGFQEFRDLLEE